MARSRNVSIDAIDSGGNADATRGRNGSMKVGVVGAGVSGLAVVRELANRDVDVVGFEALGEPGGVMRSRRVDGHVLELGPQRLRLTAQIAGLVDDLGLRDELRIGDEDQPIYVYVDGDLKVVPLSVREALTTDLLSLSGKLRILKEPLTGPAREGESVEAFLTRKFGRQAARRFFGPLYSGLYGTDPDEMLMEYSLGKALRGAGIDGSVLLWVIRKLLAGRDVPAVCTFDEGLGTLANALYEENADSIHLDTPVSEVRPDGDGFEIATDEGTTSVDEVVVTTHAGTSADLLSPVDGELADTLRRFNYNPIAMVYLESDLDRPGIGTLIPWYESPRISGTTWNASFLHRDRLFTCYVDLGSYPEMLDVSEETVGSVAAEEFETITGASATPIHVHQIEPGMPSYDRSWKALDDLNPPEGIHFCTAFTERPGIPGRLRHAARVARDIAGQ